MLTALRSVIERPPPGADPTSVSGFRILGTVVAGVGVLAVLVALILNVLVATGDAGAANLPWTFGLTVAGFGTVKAGIAIILLGIIIRLWTRIDSVRDTLPELKKPAEPEELDDYSDLKTEFGKIQRSPEAPGLIPPMIMARKLWAPMLVMGPFFLLAGLALAGIRATDPDTVQAISAWTQGTMFLGETFLLAAIAFILGAILASLRTGGGEVQQSMSLTVFTPRMPKTGIFFILLLFFGILIGIAQFILYGAIAAWTDNPAQWFAWLGPLREVGLGTILAGIVLALYVIGTALAFQHWRIRQIIETGR